MISFKMRNISMQEKILALKDLFGIMKLSPFYLICHIFSSFFIAFFDGLSVGLLAPLAKGIIEANFNFLENVPIFKTVISRFPNLIKSAPVRSLFILLVVVIFISSVTKNLLSYFVGLYDSYEREKYLFNLKKFVFERYLSFGKLFFDKTSHGHLSRILNFCEKIAEHISSFVNRVFTVFFTLLIYVCIMVFISWKLTIFAIIVFFIMERSIKWLIRKIEKTAQYQAETLFQLSHETFNVLSCIPLIKAYGREDSAKIRFNHINTQLRQANFSMSKKQRLIEPFQETIILTALLLLISAAALIFVRGKLGEISGFLVFFYLLRRSLPLFIAFNDARAYIVGIKPMVRAVLKIADDRGKFFVPDGNKIFTGLKDKIELNHLNFYYMRDVPVLRDLSFSIEKGKMTALVGPTGAGKTTIINLLLRFYECPRASILIDNSDIRELSSKSLLRYMAMVSQDILLFNDTLRYNITFGIDEKISEEKLIEIAKKARLYDLIVKLPNGFDTEIGDMGIKLSGGEKQRVSIARAFLKTAEILILDEATSSLDSYTERLIQEAIEEAVKGRTTIVIAHRLSTVRNADKIVVIEDGRLIEEGTLHELLERKGRFYDYWQEQKFY